MTKLTTAPTRVVASPTPALTQAGPLPVEVASTALSLRSAVSTSRDVVAAAADRSGTEMRRRAPPSASVTTSAVPSKLVEVVWASASLVRIFWNLSLSTVWANA